MSPEQRVLARHALGLPNDRNLSFRNRYVAPEGAPEHAHWLKMVACGWARDVRAGAAAGESLAPRSGEDANRLGDAFCLTLEGAGYAVDPGERLDPEDFASIDGRAA